MRRLLIILLLIAAPVTAQEERDRGYIAGLLEDALGGEGRIVRINGFSGALSSTATVERITIADEQGIWLSIEAAELQWDRSKLFGREISIQKLRAEEIVLSRVPEPVPSDLPAPEATPFRLPELPVSILLEDLTVDRVVLEEPILGEEIVFSVTGNADLADGEGNAQLSAQRLGDLGGEFDLAARFSNATGALDFELALTEPAGGLASGFLRVPDAPALSLNVEVDGTLDDLNGSLVLRTDDMPRLTGTLNTQTSDGIRDFALQMGGDVTALFAPQYRPFFGDDVSVVAQGQQTEDGAVTLDVFDLDAAALGIDGTLAIGADGLPQRIDLQGTLTPPEGNRVLLPVPGQDTYVESARLSLQFDAETSDTWRGELRADGVQTGANTLSAAVLSGTGAVSETGFDADIEFGTTDLVLADAGLNRALGNAPQGALRVNVTPDEPIRVTDLRVTAAAGALTGTLAFDTLEKALGQTFDLRLNSDDIGPLSTLAGIELGGSADLTLKGALDAGGGFDVVVEGGTSDLTLGQDMLDGLLGGDADLQLSARRDGGGITLRRLQIDAKAIDAQASGLVSSDGGNLEFDFVLADAALVGAPVSGPVAAQGTARNDGSGWVADASLTAPADVTAQVTADLGDARRVNFNASVPDITAYGAPLPGAAELIGTIDDAGDGWRLTTELNGPEGIGALVAGPLSPLRLQYSAEVPALSALDLPVPGGATLNGELRQGDDGLIVTARGTGPYDSRLSVNADLADPLTASFDVTLPDARPLGVPYEGEINVNGIARRTEEGFVIDTELAGPLDISGEVQARLFDTISADFNLALPDARPLGVPYAGAVRANGSLRQDDGALVVDTDFTGPLNASGDVIARISDRIEVDFNAALPDARPLGVPYAGALRVSGNALREASGRLSVNADIDGPLGASGRVDAQLDDGLSGDFTLQLPNVARLGVPASGPLRITGNAAQTAQGLQLTADASGPAGARASVDARMNGGLSATYDIDLPNVAAYGSPIPGRVTLDGTARQAGDNVTLDARIGGLAGTEARINGTIGPNTDIGLRGTLPLTLVNAFIDPASIQGIAQIDLRATALNLPGITGTITAPDARIVYPGANVVLDPTRLTLRLAQGRVEVDATGNFADGGQVQITGPITISGGIPADLTVRLRNARLVDPQLYEVTADGTITIRGPLTGGAQIAGQINLGETQLRVPETGMSGPSAIPDIRHVGLPRPVARTFERAGINTRPTARPEAASSRRPYGLDITVNAPNRIFVRGRGLDAELGGSVRITGTTRAPVTAGRFSLIRGRLDILGERFALDEGEILLAGDFDPSLRFVATTQTDIGTASVIVVGRARSPEVSFVSDPSLPEDEVLALILFDRAISDISPLQALQLANAVATLAGRGGGGGVFESLRRGFDLDDLDLTTGDDGAVAVRAGKYISENVYTDVTLGSDGNSELSINIDVSPNVTARGSTDSSGETSLGIFFEKDY